MTEKRNGEGKHGLAHASFLCYTLPEKRCLFVQMNLKKWTRRVESIVRKAAKITTAAYDVEEKDIPINIVTTADINVQKYLQKQLCRLIPGSAFFGEEGSTGDMHGEYVWVVDPIDGTANFARGIREFCISVGLLHNNEAVLGVVYNPAQKRMYSACKAGGAFCNGKPIHTSDVYFSKGMFCTAMSLYRKEYAPLCVKVINEAYARCNDVRRFGACAMELCYLAEGICDLFFEFRVFPWDYAGALVILKEAGGFISGHGGKELCFDKASMVIAANSRENFEELEGIVRRNIAQVPYNEVFR